MVAKAISAIRYPKDPSSKNGHERLIALILLQSKVVAGEGKGHAQSIGLNMKFHPPSEERAIIHQTTKVTSGVDKSGHHLSRYSPPILNQDKPITFEFKP